LIFFFLELDPSPKLSYDFLFRVVTACQTEYLNFKPLTKILSQVFASSDLLNESFICQNFTENGPESVLPIDHKEAVRAYELLLSLSEESIENAIINGINALGNRIDIDLKTNQKVFTKSDLNQFVTVLLNPNLLSPEYLECGLPNMLNALANIPIALQYELVRYWSKYSPEELHGILDIFQQMITMRILVGPHSTTGRPINDDPPITSSVRCMKMIYYASLLGGQFDEDIVYSLESSSTGDDASCTSGGGEREEKEKKERDMRLLSGVSSLESGDGNTKKDELLEMFKVDLSKCRKPLIPAKDFLNECMNDVLEMDQDFTHYKNADSYSFLNYPFVLNTATKCSALFFDSRVRMYSERRLSFLYGLVHGHVPSPYLKLKVRRDHLIQDALVRVSCYYQL